MSPFTSVPYQESVRAVLRLHGDFHVVCNDVTETNVCECRCGSRCGDPKPTFREAYDQWLDHVAEVIGRSIVQ